MKDHLGNTRVVFTEENGTAKELQVSNYYPFGMRFNQSNTYDIAGKTSQYMYNGKELQEDFGLDMYDYGFRMYDPALARFTTIDPLTEKNHMQSGFAYAANNPVKFIDYMGLDTVYVLDQGNRPADDGTDENTYTADLYVVQNGVINGPYSGSSYPNSVSATDNSAAVNTVNEGTHAYNNATEHDGGTKQGLNLILKVVGKIYLVPLQKELT